jgi:hypothetical protein
MIDNTRREFMKIMGLLGLTTVAVLATPLRAENMTLKQRKAQFDAKRVRVGDGYYGFGETW